MINYGKLFFLFKLKNSKVRILRDKSPSQDLFFLEQFLFFCFFLNFLIFIFFCYITRNFFLIFKKKTFFERFYRDFKAYEHQ